MNTQEASIQSQLTEDSQSQQPSSLHVPFALENLQRLSAEEMIHCQSLLLHGNTVGVWNTPKETFGHVPLWLRTVNIRARLKAHLPESLRADPALQTLLDEAVLYLTRYALLLRLGPVSAAKHSRNKPLKVTTLAHRLCTHLSVVIARGIERRFTGNRSAANGFASALSDDDLLEFSQKAYLADEIARLRRLVARGLWGDEPRQTNAIKTTTPVRGERPISTPELKRQPYQPLPDEYMEQIGPRVLWLIKDLGPNFIHFVNYLLSVQQERQLKDTVALGRYVSVYFELNVWKDRRGHEIISPPFPLRLSPTGKGRDEVKQAYAWPPRDYADVLSLAATLQRAHLFMALLLMTSRQSEMSAFKRDCVEVAADGKAHVNGKTYKATSSLEGRDRSWPAPSILVQAFAQQVELLQALERLTMSLADDQGDDALEGGVNASSGSEEPMHLWASLGNSNTADPTASLEHLGNALPPLARAVGLDDKPGGINLHPHRLRKTMARLVGIAIDGSQKVVMLLLGHEDVQTSLYYMQTDPAFRQEVEDVIREIRVIRAAKTIESMHAALHEPGSLAHAGHGGGGASVFEQAIVQHEARLHRVGKAWGADSAYELAAILTDNGNSSRLIAPGVLCTKSPREVGMCNQRRGEVSPSNCKVECPNHLELATNRRDVRRVIPILVQDTMTYFEEREWLAAVHGKRQLIQELSRFDDIGAEFRTKPEVKAVLALDLEGGL